MHGRVQAVFTVEAKLPADLAIGLFSEQKSYQTWIRFSNQDGQISPDIQGDIRGMAMKLMDVPGEKLLPAEKDAQTHDLICIGTNVFVTKDVAEFDGQIQALIGGLGGINRARKVIYKLISVFRHTENKQLRQEPVGFDQ